MSRVLSAYVANDNDPLVLIPDGDRVGFRAVLRDKQREYVHLRQQGPAANLSKPEMSNNGLMLFSLFLWIVSAISVLISLNTSTPTQFAILSAIALIWSGLWVSFLVQNNSRSRLSDFAMLSVFGGFGALLHIVVKRLGLPMDSNQIFAMIAVTGLLIMYLSRSRIALFVSIAICLIWAAFYFDGYLLKSKLLLIVPLLLSTQIFASHVLKSPLGTLLAVITAYFWGTGIVLAEYEAGRLSTLFIATLAAVIGQLHFVASSRNIDTPHGTTSLHLIFGLGLSLIGYLALMYFWVSPEGSYWKDAFMISPLNKAIWLGSVTGTLILTMCLSFRLSGGPVTSIGAALLAYVFILPIWFYDQFTTNMLSELNLEAHPNFGWVLSGCLFASLIVIAIHTFRHRYYFATLMCFTGIWAWSHILFNMTHNNTGLPVIAFSALILLCLTSMARPQSIEPQSNLMRATQHA